ncbi:hypothetical protein, partial [Shewanella nanhaiensis]
AHSGACAQADGDVNLTRELNVIDKAIVVDVLIDGDSWAGGGAAARAVVEQGVIAALCSVASRVGDGGGDRDGGARCW